MTHDPEITIQNARRTHGMFSWEGQALQYDQRNDPNTIVYQRFNDGQTTWVDCLLHYNDKGLLDGILNTYPYGTWDTETGLQTEIPGATNTFVRPGAPASVRQALVAEAKRRWPNSLDERQPEFESAPTKQRPELSPTLDETIEGIERAISNRSGIDGNRRVYNLRPRNR